MRDAIVAFIESLHTRTTIPRKTLVSWASLRRNTYYDWRDRLGQPKPSTNAPPARAVTTPHP